MRKKGKYTDLLIAISQIASGELRSPLHGHKLTPTPVLFSISTQEPRAWQRVDGMKHVMSGLQNSDDERLG